MRPLRFASISMMLFFSTIWCYHATDWPNFLNQIAVMTLGEKVCLLIDVWIQPQHQRAQAFTELWTVFGSAMNNTTFSVLSRVFIKWVLTRVQFFEKSYAKAKSEQIVPCFKVNCTVFCNNTKATLIYYLTFLTCTHMLTNQKLPFSAAH